MFGFSKKRSYLGVDFGSAGLKAVELAVERGKPRLVTYGLTEMPVDIVRNVSPEARDQAVASLKALLSAAHVTTRKAVAALPNYAVFTQIMDLPAMADKDIAAAVRWEAKKIVPWPLEEMILDWKKLATPTPKDGSAAATKVLLIAALKNVVSRYLEIFKLAEVELLSLETEAFSVARALAGSDVNTVMLVDIGAFTTDIAVVESGIPLINRTIDVGGTTLTKAIAQSLGISEQRAEQFKRDFGLAVESGGGIPKTIEAAFSPVINEVKYIFDLYQGQSRSLIQKVVLTGGSAYLPNLPGFLQGLLKVPVILGDPWDRVSYPVELKPALDEVGPMLVVAIGLALREIVS